MKKRLQHNGFPMNIAKILRAAFLKNNFGGYFCFLLI